jgi:hypothetical protein
MLRVGNAYYAKKVPIIEHWEWALPPPQCVLQHELANKELRTSRFR